MNMYMLTKCRNFKTFWKKIIQLLWDVVIYLLKNVGHGIESDIASAYGVFIH